MNKVILVCALLVATLSAAAYAHPQSNQNKLLSLLERAIEEEVDKQEVRETVKSQGNWRWRPRRRNPPEDTVTFEKELKKLNQDICRYASLVYESCPQPSMTREAVQSREQQDQSCDLEQQVETARNNLNILESPSYCQHYNHIAKLCGGAPVPKVEG